MYDPPPYMGWQERLEKVRDSWVRRFSRRSDRVVFGLVSIAILLVVLRDLMTAWPTFLALAGFDFDWYLDGTSRWLGGGPFYLPSQLEAPFDDRTQVMVYPPTALLLLAPLAALPRGLAGILWIGFPIAALAFQWFRMRPAPIVWPFLALCLVWPPTLVTIAVWNSGIVFAGFLALATVYRWPAALVFLKPSVLPFAFWGANHRSWWIAVAVLIVASIPFGSMWLDWFKVLENSRIGGIWHSIQQFPLFFVPILVWLGRTRSADGTIDRSTG